MTANTALHLGAKSLDPSFLSEWRESPHPSQKVNKYEWNGNETEWKVIDRRAAVCQN
jgi:hypothetical protein